MMSECELVNINVKTKVSKQTLKAYHEAFKNYELNNCF